VVGVGSIGATVAAAVQASGRAELVLCGRTAIPEVAVHAPWSDSPVVLGPVLDDPADAGPVDWVLLAVKAHQTPAAAGWLRRLSGPGTVVAVMQNGVEHREVVEPYAAGAEILPVVVWFGAATTAPGQVMVHTKPTLTVPDSPPGRALAGLLDGHVEVVLTGDILTESWRKLCHNAPGALMALSGRAAEIFRDPDMCALALRLAEESVQVARAEGAGLPMELAREIADTFAALPPESGTSILWDRLAGRPLEWDARNGVISRAGARHGIATPINDTLVALLAAI
jgi:2-dehydropantoate 2-reductase